MTPQEVQDDYVRTNLRLVRETVRLAKGTNKGRHSHDINKGVCRLENCLSKLPDDELSIDKAALIEMCHIRAHVCDRLWLAQNNL